MGEGGRSDVEPMVDEAVGRGNDTSLDKNTLPRKCKKRSRVETEVSYASKQLEAGELLCGSQVN